MLKPFIQVSIRNVPPVKEYYFQKSVTLCLASQSLKSENSDKGHRFWNISLFKLTFLSKYRFELINKNLNWEPYSCWDEFDWETNDFDPGIKIMLVQNFQKVVIKNDSSRLSKWCISVTTGFISCIRVTDGNHTSREKDSIQIPVDWFFASKSGHSFESIFFESFDFCWYSISYFSIPTKLISSRKVSIENLAPVEEVSF